MGILQVRYDCSDWLLIFSLYNNGVSLMMEIILSMGVVFLILYITYMLYKDDYKDFFTY